MKGDCKMRKEYGCLKSSDRLKIYDLLLDGESLQGIANAIGFHKSTVYREVSRNSTAVGYRPDIAGQTYLARRRSGRKGKVERSPELQEKIDERLREGWSPEQIAGRLNKEAGKQLISFEGIYQYIYRPAQRKKKLYKFLRYRHSFRYPRGKRRRHQSKDDKVSIHDRCSTINERESFGHWEGDLILFRKRRENLFTLRERKTRYLIAIKNKTRESKETSKALISYMKSKSKLMETLTLDNDTSFVGHKEIARVLGLDVFFCDPYKSWQKGAIENGNRLIREKLPKRMNIECVSQNEVDQILERLNKRPMKCLGYMTPQESFLQEGLLRAIT
jgi:transposase, IS30 family